MSLTKKQVIFILLIIFLLGIVIRIINIHDNIFFYYDQARDAQRILNIVNLHQIKLLGPETDIQGVFNGALFYYILAPIYSISSDPNFAALFMVFINCLGIFSIYYCAKILFNNKIVGLLSALIWMASYEQVNFARFISNSSFMGISSIIFFTGLIIYFINKNKYGIPLSIIGLALSTQFNFYLVYLIFFYPIFYFIYKPKIKKKDVLLNIALVLLLFFPFIITDIKRHFLTYDSLISYFLKQHASTNVFNGIPLYFERMKDALYYTIFSLNSYVILPLLGIVIVINYKLTENKKSYLFLIIWFISTFPLFLIQSGVIERIQINTTIDPAIIIFFALTIFNLTKIKNYQHLGMLLLFMILISNMKLLILDNFQATYLISYQPILLKEEKQVIDYIYNASNKKPFSICAISDPLFINTTWAFLFNTYGKNKYDYTPFWSGQPQFLNKSMLQYDTAHVKGRFMIIDPLERIPSIARIATIYDEDHVSKLIETKKFGQITVQNRKLQINNFSFTDTQNLTAEETISIKKNIEKEPRYTCYLNY